MARASEQQSQKKKSTPPKPDRGEHKTRRPGRYAGTVKKRSGLGKAFDFMMSQYGNVRRFEQARIGFRLEARVENGVAEG